MSFNSSIKGFSSVISERKDTIVTRKGIKLASVIPLLEILGYSVYNKYEVIPRNVDIDYIVFVNKTVQMVIKVKEGHIKNDVAKLFKNFNNAKLAIWTNGIKYLFFSFIDGEGMNTDPFYFLDICSLGYNDFNFLRDISKGVLASSNIENIVLGYRKGSKHEKVDESRDNKFPVDNLLFDSFVLRNKVNFNKDSKYVVSVYKKYKELDKR